MPPASPAAPSNLPPPGWYAVGDGRTLWWDGVQWQQHAPMAPVEPYQSVGRVGGATAVLIGLSGLVSLVAAGTEVHRYLLMDRVMDRDPTLTYSQLQSADDLATTVGLVDLGVMLVAGIVFLVWVHTVFKNLHGALRSRAVEFSPGWAVGWWFVPIANLFKPKQVMNEAWTASAPGTSDPTLPVAYSVPRKPPSLLSWWWAAWIGAGLISRFSVGWYSGDPMTRSASSLQTEFLWGAIGAGVYVVAAILAIQVVRDITQRQEARAHNVARSQVWGG